MAIIRKGDKKAEAGLRKAAIKQGNNRSKASDNQKKRAGLVSENVRINPKTKKAYTLDLGNPVTGNAYDVVQKPFSGPISGSSIARKNAVRKRIQERKNKGK